MNTEESFAEIARGTVAFYNVLIESGFSEETAIKLAKDMILDILRQGRELETGTVSYNRMGLM